MEIILLLLAIYIIPILIIVLIMYLLMEKGQTVGEFVEKTDCLNPSFVTAVIMPCINIGFMIYCIGIYLCYKLKNWRK